MNCKPGDLAIIIRAKFTPELVGHIVRVIRPWTKYDPFDSRFAWECEYPDGKMIKQAWGFPINFTFERTRPLADDVLRPIRDNDGEDETLTWVGKPHKETA